MLTILAALALQTVMSAAAPAAPAASAPERLAGSWTVDLSVHPAQPYTQPMTLTLNADGTVSGSFYQSDIQSGRWRAQNGRLCASFQTTDGRGPYQTTACATEDGRVQGETWAEHRRFVILWTATRAAPCPAA